MAGKAFVTAEEFGKFPDALKAYYKPMGEGGTDYVLDVAPERGFTFENTENLRRSLDRVKGAEAGYKAALDKFKDIDADKARGALAKLDEIDKWTPDQKVQEKIASLERQLGEKHGNEKKALLAQIEELNGLVNSTFVEAELTRAIAAHGGRAPLLLPALVAGKRVKAVRDGNKFALRVLDETGQEMVTRLPDKSGAMGVDELVASLKNTPDFAPAFAGSGPTGGGTPQQQTPRATAEFTISRSDAKDHGKWSKANEAATKAGKVLQVVDG